jgi:hypothetical protein
MTPEGRVKIAVKKLFKCHGVYAFMPVQAGYGKPGLDFHAIHCGRGFFVETKAKGKKPTERQQQTIQEVRAAGAEVFVIDDVHGAEMQRLTEWLQTL